MAASALTPAWLAGGGPTAPVLIRAPPAGDAESGLRAAGRALGLTLPSSSSGGGDGGSPWWAPASLVDWLGPDWEVREEREKKREGTTRPPSMPPPCTSQPPLTFLFLSPLSRSTPGTPPATRPARTGP